MFKLFFIGLAVLLVGFVVLRVRLRPPDAEKPIFLRTDAIADAHQTTVSVGIHSRYKPSDAQLTDLKADYANLWAHLNHLYATNDVVAGKEYYSEDWFKQLCRHYAGIRPPAVTRSDGRHALHIRNWSTDALICTAIDSNVVLTYQYPDKTAQTTQADIAVVLLYQGDHWRIDAMRVINESPVSIHP